MKAKKTKRLPLNLQIEPDLLQRIKRLAAINEGTAAFIARHILKTYVSEVEKNGLRIIP